jgi:hypothetical protein
LAGSSRVPRQKDQSNRRGLNCAYTESLQNWRGRRLQGIVRIPEIHRTDRNGKTIEESTVCWIDGTPERSVAVLRGYQQSTDAEIHMDDRTRARLGVKLGHPYDFRFKQAGFCGQLKWAWKASETGYRVASRLGVIGLIVGVLAFIPVLVDWIKSLVCWWSH